MKDRSKLTSAAMKAGPRFGGPKGGRPTLRGRRSPVQRGKVVRGTGSEGRNYLVGRGSSRNKGTKGRSFQKAFSPPWEQQAGKRGEGNLKRTLQGEINSFKRRRGAKRRIKRRRHQEWVKKPLPREHPYAFNQGHNAKKA